MSLRFAFVVASVSVSLLSPMTTCVVQAQSSSSSPATANGPVTYKTYDQTFYREQSVQGWKWVEEEVMETSQKNRWVQQYDTETLEKTSVSYRPIEKTSERIEKYTELQPVTVTKFREKKIEETSFETDIEMREETVVVKKPVVETVMRDQPFTVREKITEDSFEYKPVTTFKPIEVPETTFVPTDVVVPGTVGTRPRVQWLRPGTYVDPLTGLSVYRRRGLHWTGPTPTAAVVPALVAQTSNKIAYLPETTMKKEPIEISRFVERVETRKVPVEVKRMTETYETRKVPVEVHRPKKTVRVEKIPYQETTYREVEKVRKVPVVEKTMQKVETVEPYQRTTAKWVEKVEQIQTPKIVRKKVPYTTTKKIPYTVRMCVAVDCYGNAVGDPRPVDPRWNEFLSSTDRPSQQDLRRDVVEDRDRTPASFNVDSPRSTSGGISDSNGLRTPAPADMPPTLKTTTTSKPSVLPPTRTQAETHSVLVPPTKTEVETSTLLDTLAGPPLEVKTPLRSLAIERTPEQSVGGRDTVETSIQQSVTNETSTLKPAVETPFNKDLIAPPAAPNIAPRTFDVQGIDKVQSLERRNIRDIY